MTNIIISSVKDVITESIIYRKTILDTHNIVCEIVSKRTLIEVDSTHKEILSYMVRSEVYDAVSEIIDKASDC